MIGTMSKQHKAKSVSKDASASFFTDRLRADVAEGLSALLGFHEAEACAAMMVEHLCEEGESERRRLWMALLLELRQIPERRPWPTRSRLN